MMPANRHSLKKRRGRLYLARGVTLLISLGALLLPAVSAAGVKYTDVGKVLDYRRGPSTTIQAVLDAQSGSPLDFTAFANLPQMANGLPGIAVFDYDGDGDEDIYVTNGPGKANSLYANQLYQPGRGGLFGGALQSSLFGKRSLGARQVSFKEVAGAAGVTATDQDSQGVCYGDTDNDGDPDLLVLGRGEPNRFFENLGNGRFQQVSNALGGGYQSSSVCAMGDIDNDGRLDVFIGNSFDHSSTMAICCVPFALNQLNQLYRNGGGNRFTDVSGSSGIRATRFRDPHLNGNATITWAVSMVDVDMDGDTDIVHVDDQGSVAATVVDPTGVDRGLVHVFLNNGSGHFTDHPVLNTPEASAGAWMGISWGDLNCDGNLDFFASNFGDYAVPFFVGLLGANSGPPAPDAAGVQSSRWFLGQGNGGFTDPGVGGLTATPFGWGTAIRDFDNDGDHDILFHGGLSTGFAFVGDNPGSMLLNRGCSASFTLDKRAFPSVNHTRRTVRAVAVGDLNKDGYYDIVTAASFQLKPATDLSLSPAQWGSVYDPTAWFAAVFEPNDMGLLVWNGTSFDPGTLAVEIYSGSKRNGWIAVETVGSYGLTAKGRVNRDGVGAKVSFKPASGKAEALPVQAGSSHASQNSHELIFGMGRKKFLPGTVDVFWPGGVRNRLYEVKSGERLVLPEIPCSYDTQDVLVSYTACVNEALGDLSAAGVIDDVMKKRLASSASRAYLASRSASPTPKRKRIRRGWLF